jgi:hypothetical protein
MGRENRLCFGTNEYAAHTSICSHCPDVVECGKVHPKKIREKKKPYRTVKAEFKKKRKIYYERKRCFGTKNYASNCPTCKSCPFFIKCGLVQPKKVSKKLAYIEKKRMMHYPRLRALLENAEKIKKDLEESARKRYESKNVSKT